MTAMMSQDDAQRPAGYLGLIGLLLGLIIGASASITTGSSLRSAREGAGGHRANSYANFTVRTRARLLT